MNTTTTTITVADLKEGDVMPTFGTVTSISPEGKRIDVWFTTEKGSRHFFTANSLTEEVEITMTTTLTDRDRAIHLAEQGELLTGTNRPAARRLGHEFHTATLQALVRDGILVKARWDEARQRFYYGHADLYLPMGGQR